MTYEPKEPPPEPVGSTPARVAIRTVLLALSVLLLFPKLVDGFGHGAWSAFVERMGVWKWIAWAACFIGMTITRFAGGPRRRS